MTTVAWAGRSAREHDSAVSVSVSYQPILDVERGVAAGYQAHLQHDAACSLEQRTRWALGRDAVATLGTVALGAALSQFPRLPKNTFLSLPIAASDIAVPSVSSVLLAADTLAGIVLDVVGPVHTYEGRELVEALADYRRAGALISLGGHGAPQPELTSIVDLKPSIVRLGRGWVRGIETSKSKRSAMEVIGTLAAQLDAWILAEGVTTSAELRTLASLSVPLAQGSFIGVADVVWPEIPSMTRQVLPRHAVRGHGELRDLVQAAYTATDAASATAVLPESTGFEVVVVVDEHNRPVTMLELDAHGNWDASDVLAVNVATPAAEVAVRAMARPRATRFSPLACTDDLGMFLGVLRIERLMEHFSRR